MSTSTILPARTAALPKARKAQPWLLIVGMGAVVLVAVALKLPEFVLPMGQDQGVYNAIAEKVLAGYPLYGIIWDNQAPGVYLVHAALLAVLPGSWLDTCIPALGALGCRHLGMHAFDLLYTLAIGAALYAVARRAGWDPSVAVLSAALGVGFGQLSLLNRAGNTPEKLALLPATLAAAVYLEHVRTSSPRWLPLCGVLLGLATIFRPTAGIVALAMGAHALWRSARGLQDGRHSLVALSLSLVAGIAAAWIPLSAFLAISGALPGFVEALSINATRALMDASGGSTDALNGLRDHVKLMLAGPALLWIAGGAGTVGLLVAGSASRQALVGLWAFANLSLLLVVHEYAQLVPPLSLAAAWALFRAWRALGSGNGARAAERASGRLLLVGLVAVLLAATNERQAAITLRAWYERIPPRFSMSADEYIAGVARAEANGRPIYLWAEAANVYVLSGQPPATRFVNLAPLARAMAGVAERRNLVMQDLAANPPAVILVKPVTGVRDARDDALADLDTFPELADLLGHCYEERALPDNVGHWRMYRRLEATNCA